MDFDSVGLDSGHRYLLWDERSVALTFLRMAWEKDRELGWCYVELEVTLGLPMEEPRRHMDNKGWSSGWWWGGCLLRRGILELIYTYAFLAAIGMPGHTHREDIDRRVGGRGEEGTTG